MNEGIKLSYLEIIDSLYFLITLGKMGAVRRPIFSTTSELGSMMGISQQSASRKLTKMENSKLIIRSYHQRGNSIKITEKGVTALEEIFSDLWMILTAEGRETEKKIEIKGKVCTGIGEGAYYMSRKGYKNQFPALLSFTPYEGTLNLQLIEETSIRNFEQLLRSPSKFIKEFAEGGRRFGRVFIWPTILLVGEKKIPSALIRPDRTHHNNQMELIAKEHIKSTYGIKDGDELEVVF